LRGWWIDVPSAHTVFVMSHGYLMNRCELAPLAIYLAQFGCSSLLYDFRAHGKSGGRKSGLGWTERLDVLAAVAFAKSRAPGCRVVLVGSSMGSAASAFALAEDPGLADGLILDSAYSRLYQAISGWWRFLGGRVLSFVLSPSVVIAAPLAGFNPFRPDVASALARVKVPVLILHGDCDNLATVDEAKRNETACANARIVWFERCGHSEGRWLQPEKYNAAVVEFVGWVTRDGHRR
jgi:pimeloyl-ACP methyl ester carboxylesterase